MQVFKWSNPRFYLCFSPDGDGGASSPVASGDGGGSAAASPAPSAGDNTKFTLSLTAGGAALTLSNVSLSSNCSVSKCWVVTAIGASTVTIDCDSSSFTNFSVSGSQRTTYGCYGGSNGGTGSAAMVNIIRSRSKEAASLRTQTLQNHNDFIAAGGEFPSVYLNGGNRQVWAVWDPDNFRVSIPPQWLGLRDFSPQ